LGSITTGFDFDYAINTFVFALSFAFIAAIVGTVLAYLIIEKQRRTLLNKTNENNT
jgi:ABC-type Fe3+ transport system permease subunit